MWSVKFFIRNWYNHWVNSVLPTQNENHKLEEDTIEALFLSGSYPRLIKDIFESVIILNTETEEIDKIENYNIDDLVLETARISVSSSTKMFTFRCLYAPRIGHSFWVRSNNWYTIDRFRELCKKEESGEAF